MQEIRVRWLSDERVVVADARRLLEAYLRLPDGWQTEVPRELPAPLVDELRSLPGTAAPPAGDFAVATRDGTAVGIGAIVALDRTRCELKRVYVSPDARDVGVGSALVTALIERAAVLEYERVAIDVLPERHEAIRLWKQHGFTECDPYRTYRTPMCFLDRAIP